MSKMFSFQQKITKNTKKHGCIQPIHGGKKATDTSSSDTGFGRQRLKITFLKASPQIHIELHGATNNQNSFEIEEQSWETFKTPYSPLGFSVRGILQARILHWVAILQGIFPTRGSNSGLLHCRRILYHLSHQGSPESRLVVTKVGERNGEGVLNRHKVFSEMIEKF